MPCQPLFLHFPRRIEQAMSSIKDTRAFVVTVNHFWCSHFPFSFQLLSLSLSRLPFLFLVSTFSNHMLTSCYENDAKYGATSSPQSLAALRCGSWQRWQAWPGDEGRQQGKGNRARRREREREDGSASCRTLHWAITAACAGILIKRRATAHARTPPPLRSSRPPTSSSLFSYIYRYSGRTNSRGLSFIMFVFLFYLFYFA